MTRMIKRSRRFDSQISKGHSKDRARMVGSFFSQVEFTRIFDQNGKFVDQEKVEALKESISEFGLFEPIDVLEVEGIYYGFSGCHRFQAHQELGKEKILCKVRNATKQTLKFHLM